MLASLQTAHNLYGDDNATVVLVKSDGSNIFDMLHSHDALLDVGYLFSFLIL